MKIAFNGHAHIYERNNASAPGMPITYVTGGGGALLEPIGPCHSYDAYGIGWSPTKLKGSACGAAQAPPAASNVFHFFKVTVSGTTVTVAPTDELGRTFDVQTYSFSGTTLPDTVIDTQPTTPTNATTAAFTFHSTLTPATFACSLDGATTDAVHESRELHGTLAGAHTFGVTATTAAGSDPTPASGELDHRHHAADSAGRCRRQRRVADAREPHVDCVDRSERSRGLRRREERRP